jgi:hypothetical protein
LLLNDRTLSPRESGERTIPTARIAGTPAPKFPYRAVCLRAALMLWANIDLLMPGKAGYFDEFLQTHVSHSSPMLL